MIRIGVCHWSLDRQGPAALTRASELGFSAMHLDGDELARESWLPDGPDKAAIYAEAGDRTGVRITAISPGRLNQLGLASPVGSKAAASCEQSIGVAIAAASALGAPLIFLPSFRNGEIHDEADLRRTAEVIRAACDLAAAREDLLVATENTLSAADNLRLLALVDRPNARILLDTLNPALWGHAVAAYVEALWPHLADQVHVKDGRDGKMGNAALGDGRAGLEATAAVLKAHGFDGSLISENDYQGDGAGGAARDIAWLTPSHSGPAHEPGIEARCGTTAGRVHQGGRLLDVGHLPGAAPRPDRPACGVRPRRREGFGQVTQVSCSFCSGPYDAVRGVGYDGPAHAFLLDFAVHHIDLVRHLGGEVSHAAAFHDERDGGVSVAAALRFAGGAVGTLQLTSQRVWWRNYDRVEITGQGEYIVLDGLWGFRHYTHEQNTFWENYSDERSTELGGDGAALTEFVTAIREGRPPLTSIQDAVATMRIYQALWDAIVAARSGELNLGAQSPQGG